MSNIISDIQVFPLKKDHPNIKANGSFVVNEAFKLKFTIFKGAKGLFVGFPGESGQKINEKTGKKEWYPFVSVIDKDTSINLNKQILAVYNSKTGNSMHQGEAASASSQEEIPF